MFLLTRFPSVGKAFPAKRPLIWLFCAILRRDSKAWRPRAVEPFNYYIYRCSREPGILRRLAHSLVGWPELLKIYLEPARRNNTTPSPSVRALTPLRFDYGRSRLRLSSILQARSARNGLGILIDRGIKDHCVVGFFSLSRANIHPPFDVLTMALESVRLRHCSMRTVRYKAPRETGETINFCERDLAEYFIGRHFLPLLFTVFYSDRSFHVSVRKETNWFRILKYFGGIEVSCLLIGNRCIIEAEWIGLSTLLVKIIRVFRSNETGGAT